MKSSFILNHISLYSILRRYRNIKDIPADQKQFRPLRLNFRLWGVWYVPQTPYGLLKQDGESMPYHGMHALDGEHVIGPHDLEAGRGTKYEETWRASYAVTIAERMRLT